MRAQFSLRFNVFQVPLEHEITDAAWVHCKVMYSLLVMCSASTVAIMASELA